MADTTYDLAAALEAASGIYSSTELPHNLQALPAEFVEQCKLSDQEADR